MTRHKGTARPRKGRAPGTPEAASAAARRAPGSDSDPELDAEILELERQTERMPSVIMAVFLAVAIISLGIAAVTTWNAARRLAREVRVPGYVVEMTARRDSQGQEYYYPVVTFALPDGTRKTVQTADGSWPPAHQVDEQVVVAYDPLQPLQARIASDSSPWLLWIGPLITGALGLVFLGAVFFVRAFFQQGPPSDPHEQE